MTEVVDDFSAQQSRFLKLVYQLNQDEYIEMVTQDQAAQRLREIERFKALILLAEQMIAKRPPKMSFEDWLATRTFDEPTREEIDLAVGKGVDIREELENTKLSMYQVYLRS